MRTTASSAHGPWRKSSYSDDKGGSCVECAVLGAAAWRKSRYSGDTGGSCVEVGMPRASATVAIRDSKDPDRGHLAFPVAAFTAFVRTVAG